MAWIEAHQALQQHPKVFDLMSAMGWGLDETLGKLLRFWWWCVDYAEDGNLERHNAHRIGAAMGVSPSESERLMQNLIAFGFIDEQPYFRVHDWWQYIGPFLQSRYRHHPNKWKRIKRLYHSKKNGSQTVSKTVSKTGQPNLTVPNQPNRKKIKDGATAPPVQLPDSTKDRLKTFMAYLAHKLAKCTGGPQPAATRQAFGVVIAYLKDHPDEIAAVSQDIDRLPVTHDNGQAPVVEWYVQAIRAVINRRKHDHTKQAAARPVDSTVKGLTAPIGRPVPGREEGEG